MVMLTSFVNNLETSLKAGDFTKSIELLRNWLAGAKQGEPKELLSSCSDSVRPKVSLLMRDLVSRYPSTILGLPLLMYATPEDDYVGILPPRLKLPFPAFAHIQPCSDLRFLGWVPNSTEVPIPLPFRPEHHQADIPWFKPTSVVALFRSHPGVVDLDALEIPSLWWGELFRSIDANVRLSGRMLLSYPDALEASVLMEASALGEPTSGKRYFLSDAGWSWAGDEGLLFQETCRHQPI